MKRLSKQQISERDALVERLRAAGESLNSTVERANEQIRLLGEEVTEELRSYNEIIEEINEWKSSIAQEAREYFDERSDRWQTSEAGDAYNSWIDELDEPLEEAKTDEPESIEPPDTSAVSDLEGLPESPG